MSYYQSLDKVTDGIRSLFTPAAAAAADQQQPTAGDDAKNQPDKDLSDLTADEVVEYFGFGRFQLRIIVVSAVLTAADAMEMMLLAVLGPALRCDWHLTPRQVAMLTTFVFVGMFAGAPTWGSVSDKCGRKAVLAISAVLIGYYGLLCSGAPSYTWVVILRCLIGFNIGGGGQCYTLLSEYLPQNRRVYAMIGNLLCWGVGGTLEILLAWAVLPRLGWRALAAFTALPVLLAMPLFLTMPESLRYLLASGQEAEVAKVTQQMARENGRPPLKGRLAADATTVDNRGHITQLFHSSIRRTTLTLFPLWFGVAFTYYGLALLSSDVAAFKQRCLSSEQPRLLDGVDLSCCRRLDSDDFRTMLLTALGEFVFQPLNLVLLDRVGRKITMAGLYATAAVFVGLIGVCLPSWATVMFLCLARGCASALFGCCFVYTAEVYPTSVRSLGIGLNSAMARVGSMLTPLVAQVLLPEVSIPMAFAVYVVMNAAGCALALSLPIETKGRALRQSVEPEVKGDSSREVKADTTSETKTD